MKYFFFILLLIGCAGSKKNITDKDVLHSDKLQAVGRTLQSQNGLELVSSASHFGFSFDGSQCSLYIQLPSWLSHSYIQYTVDGSYMDRVRITNEKNPLEIIVDKDGPHEIWIYKTTEALTGPVYVKRIEAKNVKPLVPPSKPMIEFIGNSITCGAASDFSEIPCGSGVYHDQHNAFLAYGPIVARELDMSFMLSSVSGIGIYRNWNSDGPAMPAVYDKVDFQPNSSSWNFKKYEPKIISIALGTNDLSNGDGKKRREAFDSSIFVNEYVKFIQKIHGIYPTAKIALLSSPMMQGAKRETLQNCLTLIKQKAETVIGESVHFYFFKPMKAKGCTGHPSVEDHSIMAEELVPFFRGLLND